MLRGHLGHATCAVGASSHPISPSGTDRRMAGKQRACQAVLGPGQRLQSHTSQREALEGHVHRIRNCSRGVRRRFRIARRHWQGERAHCQRHPKQSLRTTHEPLMRPSPPSSYPSASPATPRWATGIVWSSQGLLQKSRPHPCIPARSAQASSSILTPKLFAALGMHRLILRHWDLSATLLKLHRCLSRAGLPTPLRSIPLGGVGPIQKIGAI